ncbi:MAG: TetR/AcrR family transcriptional regulator [Clostridia bacterium]|nr:TetR/AcrR family transcriptional regulator [Clostridia bacterium]
MPKIIAGLRERLLEEAERQLAEGGYGKMTIRAVAKECHVAVGTVYNYFAGKEEFVAYALLVRWNKARDEITAVSSSCTEPKELVRCMYDQLCSFIDQYRVLFRDEEAIAVFTASMGRYHDLLRSQLAQPLQPFCQSEFEAEFVAEAVLTWTVAGEGFDAIYQVIQKILRKEK